MNLNNQTQLGVRAIIKNYDGLIMVEHDEKKHGRILIFPGGGIEFYVLCSVVNGELSLGHDPELGKNEQILKDVREVGWEEIRNNKWFPEELYGRLENDLKEGFENTVYLGLKRF